MHIELANNKCLSTLSEQWADPQISIFIEEQQIMLRHSGIIIMAEWWL